MKINHFPYGYVMVMTKVVWYEGFAVYTCVLYGPEYP